MHSLDRPSAPQFGIIPASLLFSYISISNNDKWSVMMTTTEKVLVGGDPRVPDDKDKGLGNGRKITNGIGTIEWNGGRLDWKGQGRTATREFGRAGGWW